MEKLKQDFAFDPLSDNMLLDQFPYMRLDNAGERIETWMYWGRKTLPLQWG